MLFQEKNRAVNVLSQDSDRETLFFIDFQSKVAVKQSQYDVKRTTAFVCAVLEFRANLWKLWQQMLGLRGETLSLAGPCILNHALLSHSTPLKSLHLTKTVTEHWNTVLTAYK